MWQKSSWAKVLIRLIGNGEFNPILEGYRSKTIQDSINFVPSLGPLTRDNLDQHTRSIMSDSLYTLSNFIGVVCKLEPRQFLSFNDKQASKVPYSL